MATIVLILLIGGVIFLLAGESSKNRNRKHELEFAYRQALRGTDKERAMRLGRTYYSFIRKGKLTSADQQTIADEVSAMRESS